MIVPHEPDGDTTFGHTRVTVGWSPVGGAGGCETGGCGAGREEEGNVGAEGTLDPPQAATPTDAMKNATAVRNAFDMITPCRIQLHKDRSRGPHAH